MLISVDASLTNSFFSFIHVCFYKSDVVFVVNSANGPFGLLTKIFNIKTFINVDGLEWMRPKWKGLGSIYFKFSSKLATILFDRIITDSDEMNKVYFNLFSKKTIVIAYGSTMRSCNKTVYLDEFKIETKKYYLIVGRLIPDNNSELIIKGFLDSKSQKKLVIVGDVPYKDKYSQIVKSINSNRIIFTGYIKCQDKLSAIYKNCYGYIHGHEYGGTNPTMINALDLNCQIIALKTKFNKEMLKNKYVLFFEKNLKSITETINLFEKKYQYLIKKNKNYKIPKKYEWDFIVDQYLKCFKEESK